MREVFTECRRIMEIVNSSTSQKFGISLSWTSVVLSPHYNYSL